MNRTAKILAVSVAAMLAILAVAGVAYAAFNATYTNDSNNTKDYYATVYFENDQAMFNKNITYDTTTTFVDGAPVTSYVFGSSMNVTNGLALISTADLKMTIENSDDAKELEDLRYKVTFDFSDSLVTIGGGAAYELKIKNTTTNAEQTKDFCDDLSGVLFEEVTAGTYEVSLYVTLSDSFEGFSSDELLKMTDSSVTVTAVSCHESVQ